MEIKMRRNASRGRKSKAGGGKNQKRLKNIHPWKIPLYNSPLCCHSGFPIKSHMPLRLSVYGKMANELLILTQMYPSKNHLLFTGCAIKLRSFAGGKEPEN